MIIMALVLSGLKHSERLDLKAHELLTYWAFRNQSIFNDKFRITANTK